MLTQEDIEEFFFEMMEELQKENIPILNDYTLRFKDYPTKEELKEQEEIEMKEYAELEYEIIEENY